MAREKQGHKKLLFGQRTQTSWVSKNGDRVCGAPRVCGTLRSVVKGALKTEVYIAVEGTLNIVKASSDIVQE